MKYRPEIDGLRAFAVFSVILYHAEFSIQGRDWFAGGFIGVDIFFVISGYLISRIILDAVANGGRFNYAHFYERRARRILPMLLVVMLSSFPFAWAWLLPEDFVEYANSILSSLLFVSNFFFYFSTTEYGADSALLKPFLHTWSLSVEEQFYILFPAFLIFLSGAFRKHLLTAILVSAAASLALAEFMSFHDRELNFFMLPTRAWELLVGTALVLLESRQPIRRRHPVHSLLPLLGLLLIGYSVVQFGETTRHPGAITVIPILGVALIIRYAGTADLTGKLLSSRPVVFIGLISYSLYLWHFPIFAFGRVQFELPTVAQKIAWLSLTVLLSIASYFLVEQPFRNRQRFGTRIALSSIGALSLVALLSSVVIVSEDGFQSRVPPILGHLEQEKRNNAWISSGESGLPPCNDRNENFCEFGQPDKQTVFVIGDSHAARLTGDLIERLKTSYRVVPMTKGACWPLRGFDKVDGLGQIDEGCDAEFQALRLREIARTEDAFVIVSGRLPLYLTQKFPPRRANDVKSRDWGYEYHHAEKTFQQGVVDTLNEIAATSRALIIVYPVPEVRVHVSRQVMRRMPANALQVEDFLEKNPLVVGYDTYRERTESSFGLLDAVGGENVFRVYPHRIFCHVNRPGECVTHDNRILFYDDDNHVSASGAALINQRIIETIALIEQKDPP